MRFSSLLAAGAALSAALLSTVAASPTVMSTIPDHISENVRRELSTLPADQYTIHERDIGHQHKKRAQINGVQNECRGDRCLSITFDDGPYIYSQKLVDTLGNAGNQKATFFVNGNNYRCIYDDASVRALRYAYERGHEICSHTWSHPNIANLNNQQLDRQVQLVEDALWKILGVVPACFRAPFGSIRADQVRYLNDRWGVVVVGWNRDTNDANGAGTQAGLNLYRNLRAPTKAIVLNHETVPGTPNTVIPQAVNIVRQNGYVGSRTTASTLFYNPYKVTGRYGNRDGSWTCAGKPAPGGV
ncbi:Polysaccharide deacetylase [Kalmanozyma brasiliensis GHG001]|uniref:NodB homology domain-containing protein n=1 Tax=Kalmanozyma brasiliensis (strain GHG001) TaxID=1365824 RepID=V5EYE5_KALBG|nr:Polysaccharide deacetylase [Kalmanozyma brasiliensis GHG001]EST07739.1 Polysaccharide deacetylase [Kalmanozyma brasiliensis GHG001]